MLLTSLLERYVQLGMARRRSCSFLSPSWRTDLPMSLHGLLSRFSGLCGSTVAPRSELRTHQMARSAECRFHSAQNAGLSSNGYPVELRTSGFTPHFRLGVRRPSSEFQSCCVKLFVNPVSLRDREFRWTVFYLLVGASGLRVQVFTEFTAMTF